MAKAGSKKAAKKKAPAKKAAVTKKKPVGKAAAAKRATKAVVKKVAKAVKKVAKKAAPKKAPPSKKAAPKPAPAAKAAAKKPEPAAKAAAKKPEPAAKAAAKKPEPAVKVAAKKPEPAAKTGNSKPVAAAAEAPKKAPLHAVPPAAPPRKPAAEPRERESSRPDPDLEDVVFGATEQDGIDTAHIEVDLAGVKISAHPDSQLTQRQVELLYQKLMTERERVIVGFDRHLQEALGEAGVMPDETDMAQRSTEQAYLIRFADKERKLLHEIERALEKMRSGEYGVCEGTDEPIGYKRLELRPWTRYSVAYKEQIERERSQHRR